MFSVVSADRIFSRPAPLSIGGLFDIRFGAGDRHVDADLRGKSHKEKGVNGQVTSGGL